MDFATLPPEVNSGLMYAGPGSGPIIAAAASWDSLAAEVSSAAGDYGSVISGLTSGPWRGPASASMVAAAAPYVSWMNATAAQAEQAADQAKAAASAYETAFTATVPPPVIAANRTLLASLVSTNILGQNTPAIAATEAHYAEMWAQDAAAMYGYAGSSAAASTLTPFVAPPATTTVGQSIGTGTPATVSQLVTSVPAALAGAGLPCDVDVVGIRASGAFGFTDRGIRRPRRDSRGSSMSCFRRMAWGSTPISGTPYFRPASTRLLTRWAPLRVCSAARLRVTRRLGPGKRRRRPTESAAAVAAPAAGLSELGGLGGGVSAAMGRGAAIGALAVPPSWTAIAPTVSPLPLSGAALGAMPPAPPPAVAAGMPAMPFANAAGNRFRGATPRYGFRPTVMAHPPAAG